MTIGILTFHRAVNCGAMLQAWALRSYLRQEGHEVGFIENHVGEWQRWNCLPQGGSILGRTKMLIDTILRNIGTFACRDITIDRFGTFRQKYLPEIDVEDCDVVIIGSDQVWRPSLTLRETAVFRGESFPNSVRKLSYAASFGDSPLPSDELERLVERIKSFSALSVREELVRDQLCPKLDNAIAVVADPTLLLDAESYSEIEETSCLPQAPYLFAYAVHATPFFVETAKAAAKRLGLKLVMTAAAQNTRWKAPAGLTYGVSPDRMIGYLRRAECVVASSFHGTALSALHAKPFVSLCKDGLNVQSRPASFLRKIGEESRVIGPTSGIEKVFKLLKTPISAQSRERLAEYRHDSRRWLQEALQGERG